MNWLQQTEQQTEGLNGEDGEVQVDAVSTRARLPGRSEKGFLDSGHAGGPLKSSAALGHTLVSVRQDGRASP
ncbi:hypothetical protein TgHK011_006918 [Trichoderma gracile]|nr:hypothetical protein TgHK011_006918 [Trichoderma gracile]